MLHGSCLCGNIRYEIRGDPGPAYYCHCSRCRKAGGSAFASNAVVAAQDFVIVSGQDSLKTFSTKEGVHRDFCGNCGSPLISRRDALPDMVRVRMGTIDTPLQQGPGAHIYVASKADWHAIHDTLPQYPERPPAIGKR
ncbi:GFA family protein [Solimonas sp. K1W22B-7]|nr:GFA family protein [Solimonas sp. K1W22B-7]AXQ30547.1 GFA family protein [Solimonas sp. K1W22B-7]